MNGASAEMPRYQCHKKVWALKIGEGAIEVHPDQSVTVPIADGGYAPVHLAAEVVKRYMPRPGDYYVVYDDGYKSISPAKAFEDGYARI
jgi:hypothetical protein